MPVLFGLPPVIGAVIPGKESEGNGVCALENSTPCPTSLASAEPGWVWTYQARSLWWSPSTEISKTCFAFDSRALAASGPAAARLLSTRPPAQAYIKARVDNRGIHPPWPAELGRPPPRRCRRRDHAMGWTLWKERLRIKKRGLSGR